MSTPLGRRGVSRCALAAALFGATTPIASRIADDASAPMLAGLLYLGAAGAVVPLAGRRPRHSGAFRRGGRRLAIAVVAGGLLGPLLLMAGLARTPAATASLLLNLELVATLVFAAALFGEHVGRRVAAGSALVLAAGVVLTWSGPPTLRSGALLVVAACCCWGLDNCVTAAIDDIAAEHVTLIKGSVAGSTNLAIGLAVDGGLPSVGIISGAVLVGALGYGASITLWVNGARELGAARGQLVFAAAPFFGAALAWTMFGDDVRWVELLALGLALVGVLGVSGSDHDHEHPHAEVEHDHEHSHDEGHHDHDHNHHDAEQRRRAGLSRRLSLRAGSASRSDRHSHWHRHPATVHHHPHVPDLHHRHDHVATESTAHEQ